MTTASPDVTAQIDECWRILAAKRLADQLSIPGIGRAMQDKMSRTQRFATGALKAARNPRNKRNATGKVYLTKKQRRQLFREGIVPNDLGGITLRRRERGQVKAIRQAKSARKVAAAL